mgnify:FL=1
MSEVLDSALVARNERTEDMKMAKASKADMDMALKLCSALEAVDRRFFPEGSEGSNDPEDLDLNDDEHCGQVLRHLHDVLQGGSIGRVIWGMYVLLDPANKLVDPNASTLEAHPEAEAAEKDAERYRWLRAQHWDTGLLAVVADPKDAIKLGYDCPSLARLDEQIDAAMLAQRAVGAV